MKLTSRSIRIEKKTVRVMISMYCNSHHDTTNNVICKNCNDLLEYALLRIDNCVYGINKTSCEKCPVHCYNNKYRDEIRVIMRYAGPRMLFKYPELAIKHLLRKNNK